MATWLRGLYYGDTWYKDIPKDIFMKNYHDVLDHIMSNATIKIACLKEEPDVILGYVLTNNDGLTLHWIFAKTVWRKIGIAKSLLIVKPTAVTHISKLGKAIMPPSCVYNPFLIT